MAQGGGEQLRQNRHRLVLPQAKPYIAGVYLPRAEDGSRFGPVTMGVLSGSFPCCHVITLSLSYSSAFDGKAGRCSVIYEVVNRYNHAVSPSLFRREDRALLLP